MKVLIADDDETERSCLRRLLATFDVDIVEATDGFEALLIVEGEDPDAMVLAVTMPRMDGLAVLRSIRTSPAYGLMPVLCLCNTRDRHLVQQLLDVGISDYVVKPISPGPMLDKLVPFLSTATRWRVDEAVDRGAR